MASDTLVVLDLESFVLRIKRMLLASQQLAVPESPSHGGEVSPAGAAARDMVNEVLQTPADTPVAGTPVARASQTARNTSSTQQRRFLEDSYSRINTAWLRMFSDCNKGKETSSEGDPTQHKHKRGCVML